MLHALIKALTICMDGTGDLCVLVMGSILPVGKLEDSEATLDICAG